MITIEITREQAEAIMSIHALLRTLPRTALHRLLPISPENFEELGNLATIISIKTFSLEENTTAEG